MQFSKFLLGQILAVGWLFQLSSGAYASCPESHLLKASVSQESVKEILDTLRFKLPEGVYAGKTRQKEICLIKISYADSSSEQTRAEINLQFNHWSYAFQMGNSNSKLELIDDTLFPFFLLTAQDQAGYSLEIRAIGAFNSNSVEFILQNESGEKRICDLPASRRLNWRPNFR